MPQKCVKARALCLLKCARLSLLSHTARLNDLNNIPRTISQLFTLAKAKWKSVEEVTFGFEFIHRTWPTIIQAQKPERSNSVCSHVVGRIMDALLPLSGGSCVEGMVCSHWCHS